MQQKLQQKIAILGGGQLGKMLLQAGSRLGLSMTVMDKNHEFPAATLCSEFECGDITDYDDVLAFGLSADVITIEIENVNLEALSELENLGKKVFPSPAVLKIIKDKGKQKLFYKEHGFLSSNFKLYKNADQIISDLQDGQLTYPFVQKLRNDGYDGKGVQIVRCEDDLIHLFDQNSLVEDLVDVEKEIAVIVARNQSGQLTSYPAVEMEFHPTANLVEFLFSPANISKEMASKAENLATELATAFKMVGLLAVEMFIDKSGQILINEVAPRPHNSGHHTIEACVTSQYEMHLRAIMNLPLGHTHQIRPAVMLNLLGEDGHIGKAIYENVDLCLAKSGVYPHIYGKRDTKPFRKMGHVTITADTIDEAKENAKFVKNNLKVIS